VSSFIYASACIENKNYVVPRWIGPTNCQPKWLRTRSAEIRHEKILWLLILSCWQMNCEWNNIKKVRTAKISFWKLNRRNRVFGFWILRSVRFCFWKTNIQHFHRVSHTPATKPYSQYTILHYSKGPSLIYNNSLFTWTETVKTVLIARAYC